MPWELLRAAPGGGGAGTGDGLTPPPAPARCGAARGGWQRRRPAGGWSGRRCAAPAPARYACSAPSGEGSCWPGKPLLPPRSPEHRCAPRPVPTAAVPAAPCPASPAPAWEKRPRRWLGGSDTPGRGQRWAVSSVRHGMARYGTARLGSPPTPSSLASSAHTVRGKNERHLKWPQNKKPRKPCLS